MSILNYFRSWYYALFYAATMGKTALDIYVFKQYLFNSLENRTLYFGAFKEHVRKFYRAERGKIVITNLLQHLKLSFTVSNFLVLCE